MAFTSIFQKMMDGNVKLFLLKKTDFAATCGMLMDHFMREITII